MSEVFIIKDIDAFVQASRVLVFNSFDENKDKELSHDISKLHSEELSELDSILSQNECMIIAKEFFKTQVNKTTQETRLVITEKKYLRMIEAFNDRMVSNMLNNLVKKGIVDSAYDDEANDFVFWLKNK